MRASLREFGLGALDAEAVARARVEQDATEKQAVLTFLTYLASALRMRSMASSGEALDRLRAVARTEDGEPIEDIVVVGATRERYFDAQELLSFASLPDLSARAEEIDRLIAELSETV